MNYKKDKNIMNLEEKFTFALNNHDDYSKFSCWIYLWQNILINWNNLYFQINELNYYFTNNKNIETSFSNSNFFDLGKYAWPYSLSNAELIVEEAKFHKNLHDLLLSHPFDGSLSLHKTLESLIAINTDYNEADFLEFQISNSVFANSKKNQQDYFNSLEIAGWTYIQVIISAICYCIENIYIENQKLTKTIFWETSKNPQEMQKKSLYGDLRSFFYNIFDYVLYFETNEALIDVFKETNIISVYRLQWIKAFNMAFKEIDEKTLGFRDLYCKKNGIDRLALFRILKAFNLNIIFPDQLILTIVAWSSNKNHFHEIRNMLNVCQSFLEKLDLFQSIFKNPENFGENIEKTEIEKLFIIHFFQLQTIDGIGIERQYGNLENQDFIKLVKFFHTLFPSFSLEKIYSITENEYLILENKKKRVETIEKLKEKLKNIKFWSILPFTGAFWVAPQLTGGASLSPQITRFGVPPEVYVTRAEPATRSRLSVRGGQLVLQAQTNTPHQVLKQKTPPGQLHLTIGGASKQAQLAQNDSKTWLVEVYDKTGGEFFVSKCKKYIIVHGAGGNYGVIDKQMKDLTKFAKDIGADIIEVNDIVKAHLAPNKVRKNCCVSTDIGAVILSSTTWNQIEESGKIPSRNLIFRDKFIGKSFEEIMQNMHDQAREEIITKLDTLSNLSPEQLLIQEITIEGHKEMSCISAKQLCYYHESLNVVPEEGYFVFLVRDAMSKMKELYGPPKSPIQMAMFHTPGDGARHIKPGVLLQESLGELDNYYIIGMGVCENISEPLAKEMLQKELASLHYMGYVTATQAGQRFANLEKQQKQGEVTGLPSFQSSSSPISPEPGTPQFAEDLEQKRQMALKKTPLGKDEALQESTKSEVQRIGDCNKVPKHPLRRVGGRQSDQLFDNNFRQGRAQSTKANVLKSHPISFNNTDG